MVKPIVPTTADTATKWVEETPRRAPYYERETPKAAARWESEAAAAKDTYKAAIAAPDISTRFAGGIKRAGAAKFVRKVVAVGVPRFGPGISAAKEDYSKGIDPMLAEIAATDIPVRKPRGDPANYDRVVKIGTALNKKRLALLAAS